MRYLLQDTVLLRCGVNLAIPYNQSDKSRKLTWVLPNFTFGMLAILLLHRISMVAPFLPMSFHDRCLSSNILKSVCIHPKNNWQTKSVLCSLKSNTLVECLQCKTKKDWHIYLPWVCSSSTLQSALGVMWGQASCDARFFGNGSGPRIRLEDVFNEN